MNRQIVAGLTIVLLSILTLCSACAHSRRDDPASERLTQLAAWMSGSFSSAAQAAEDPDFLDIRLHMVPIWTHRDDSAWLYVEQAVADHQDRPYRQRVYRVSSLGGDLFESRVYSFADPLQYAGSWQHPERLDALSPADLEPRQGCEILMRFTGSEFAGSTLGRLCSSELRGASFATSEVRITDGEVLSWDRGWNEAGDQVWGAEKGGYRFIRQRTR